MTKTKVLWIEDGAHGDMEEMAVSMYTRGDIELTCALDATSAIARIAGSSFHVVIFDLRLGPGTNEHCRRVYADLIHRGEFRRLGLHLLLSYFGVDNSRYRLSVKKPKWLIPQRVGILSVELWSEVSTDLATIPLQRDVYIEKQADLDDDALLRLVQLVATQAANMPM